MSLCPMALLGRMQNQTLIAQFHVEIWSVSDQLYCVSVLFQSVWFGLEADIQQCAELGCTTIHSALSVLLMINGDLDLLPPTPSQPNEWMTEISAAASGALFPSQKISTHILFTLSHQLTHKSQHHSTSLSHKTVIKEVFFRQFCSCYTEKLLSGVFHFCYNFQFLARVIWMNNQQ